MWKDFKWVEKRFGTKFANILKGVKDIAEKGGQEISNHFITSETGEVTFKDLDDNNHVLVTTEALQDEDSPVKELFDESVASLLAKNGLIEVKWQELKDKRDNGELIPGSLYRITDYQCTTTQENTRSAGHQFDIVLLALSENKLAEEGWAMMNESNIYDVTFIDGVTKKCYVYFYTNHGDNCVNVVDCVTMLGTGTAYEEGDIEINEQNKTINYPNDSSALTTENLTYNYFQNSNLSAWKVWYCLDNDKSRFAWADNAETKEIRLGNDSYYRDVQEDVDGYFAWHLYDDTLIIYTTSANPKVGDMTYDDTYIPNGPIDGISGIGRGVIYRLIDEWNNDIKYDFKNIQFNRKITNGRYDVNGTETWCYTLNVWYNDICQDASIVGNTLPNDEGYVEGVYGNSFGSATAYNFYLDGVNTYAFALGDNVILSIDDNGGAYFGIYSNTIGNYFYRNTIGNGFNDNTIGHGFKNNTIGDGFSSNTIGNNFYEKTIGDDIFEKNYGNNGVELATKS